jgi:XTP/dITP diphosphohydrolase
MTSFVLATANRHKAEEMRAVLSQLDIEVLVRPDEVPEVDETEDSLEGNALLKAVALVDATGEAAIADDTGLFVDALDGRPGVFSARYAGEGASYHDNVVKLLGELAGAAQRAISHGDRRGVPRRRSVLGRGRARGDHHRIS